MHREIAALVGDAIGLGVSVAGKVVRWPKLPIEAASLLSFADNQPVLRAASALATKLLPDPA